MRRSADDRFRHLFIGRDLQSSVPVGHEQLAPYRLDPRRSLAFILGSKNELVRQLRFYADDEIGPPSINGELHGLLLRLNAIPHSLSLFLQLSECQCSVHDAENSNGHQQIVREDSGLVPTVLALFFLACVVDCWAANLLWERGWSSRAGWLVAALCVALCLCAGITFWTGCYPWHWYRCLHDGQKRGEYRQSLQHNSAIVPMPRLDSCAFAHSERPTGYRNSSESEWTNHLQLCSAASCLPQRERETVDFKLGHYLRGGIIPPRRSSYNRRVCL